MRFYCFDAGIVTQVLPEVVKMLRRLKEQEEAAKDAKESDNSEEEDSSDAATGDMGSHSVLLLIVFQHCSCVAASTLKVYNHCL